MVGLSPQFVDASSQCHMNLGDGDYSLNWMRKSVITLIHLLSTDHLMWLCADYETQSWYKLIPVCKENCGECAWWGSCKKTPTCDQQARRSSFLQWMICVLCAPSAGGNLPSVTQRCCSNDTSGFTMQGWGGVLRYAGWLTNNAFFCFSGEEMHFSIEFSTFLPSSHNSDSMVFNHAHMEMYFPTFYNQNFWSNTTQKKGQDKHKSGKAISTNQKKKHLDGHLLAF